MLNETFRKYATICVLTLTLPDIDELVSVTHSLASIIGQRAAWNLGKRRTLEGMHRQKQEEGTVEQKESCRTESPKKITLWQVSLCYP